MKTQTYKKTLTALTRCLFVDRVAAENQLKRDIKNGVSKKGVFIIKEVPAPFLSGEINPHISRFVLSDNKIIDIFHVKPVYYLTPDGQWRDMEEAFIKAGNKNLVLKYEYFRNAWIDFGYLNWLVKRCALLGGHVWYSSKEVSKFPVVLNTVSTFFPDPNPETSTVDGYVADTTANQTWSNKRNGAGTVADDTSATTVHIFFDSSTTSGNWDELRRAIFLFDTSTIGSSSTIISATCSIASFDFPPTKADDLAITPNIALVSSNPASNTALVGTDFATLGTTDFATRMAYASWSNTDQAYNDFAMNSTGIAAISKTGITKLGLRNGQYDSDNSAPTWSSNLLSYFRCYYADQAGTSADPKLVVTHFIIGTNNLALLGVT